MPKATSRKAQPAADTKQLLTTQEIRRIAEKIAVELGNDSEHIALVTLLFEHLYQTWPNLQAFSLAISTIKDQLFADTNEASEAQRQFQTDAYKNRGKLLLWPRERKGAS